MKAFFLQQFRVHVVPVHPRFSSARRCRLGDIVVSDACGYGSRGPEDVLFLVSCCFKWHESVWSAGVSGSSIWIEQRVIVDNLYMTLLFSGFYNELLLCFLLTFLAWPVWRSLSMLPRDCSGCSAAGMTAFAPHLQTIWKLHHPSIKNGITEV